MFLEGLGDVVAKHSDLTKPPLLVDLRDPYPLRLRLYLYNCTNPPGGRSIDEYKFQVILPGQKRGSRGMLDFSDGRMPVLAAYASLTGDKSGGVFVLWDPYKRSDFAYSANMQVRAETIIKALNSTVSISRRDNDEMVLAARPEHLLGALRCRVQIMHNNIKVAAHESTK